MKDSIVIVGGGHAAAQLCAVLAEAGMGAQMHVVCEEPEHPYHRPPLSKTYLKSADETLQLHRDVLWYATHGITIHLEDPVRSVDQAAHKVHLASGATLDYGKLILATGTRARTLPALAEPRDNVMTLRSAFDAAQMRACLLRDGAGQLTIIGGGFIGLEVAATARHLGWEVRLLESASRLLTRSTSPELSAQILQHHTDMGTRVELGAAIDGFDVKGNRVVSLNVNGEKAQVDHLLVAIGSIPEVGLAEQAALQVDNGICVDAAMVTSDPDILAVGDCTSFEYHGKRIRLESVQNANDQAKVAAATILGRAAAYAPTPSFWSDQGGLRLQMVGLWHPGLESIRRAGASTGSFSLFHYDGDTLVAVESCNAPVDHMWSRKLLDKGVSPPGKLVGDANIPLKSAL